MTHHTNYVYLNRFRAPSWGTQILSFVSHRRFTFHPYLLAFGSNFVLLCRTRSTKVLVKSSRHHKMAHNRCAGVHNPIFETFVIDLASRNWKRLPQTGEFAVWVKIM